jgi:Amino acid kinase family
MSVTVRSRGLARGVEVDCPISGFSGHTVVVKYGGAAMERSHLRTAFSRDIAALPAGTSPIVVHGGEPRIARGMETPDRSVPDDATMKLIESAVRQVDREVVQLLARHGVSAMGLSSWPGPFVPAARCRCHPPVDRGTWDVRATSGPSLRVPYERCRRTASSPLSDRSGSGRTTGPTTSMRMSWPARSRRPSEPLS